MLRWGRIACWTVIALVGARGQYVVSVMAGYIHHVEGAALLDGRRIQVDASDLLHLRDGQRLTTLDGPAELMLTPGSFLRIGARSAVEMIEAGLLASRMRIVRGSAIVELPSLYEQESFTLLVGTDEIRPLKAGRYRVDVDAAGDGVLTVERGRAQVSGAGWEFRVGSKRRVRLGQSPPTQMSRPAPQDLADSLARWNLARNRELAAQAEAARRADPQAAADAEAQRRILELILHRPTYEPRPQPQPRSSTGGATSSGGRNR